jgi:hypothetical protein
MTQSVEKPIAEIAKVFNLSTIPPVPGDWNLIEASFD